MKSWLIVAALLGMQGAPAWAVLPVKPGAAPAQHPIIGKWTWTRSTNKCTEVYDYRPDGTLYVVSGAEQSTTKYQIAGKPDAHGFYELKGRLVKTNGLRDCSDSPPGGPAKPYTLYIIFHHSEPQYLACQSAGLDHCFGPLTRVRP